MREKLTHQERFPGKERNLIISRENLIEVLSDCKSVEFLGMQGSGKTTLMNWLHDNCDVSIVESNHQWRATWKQHPLFFCCKYPLLIVWWVKTAFVESLRVKKPKLFLHKLNMMLILVARWEYIHKKPPERVSILDEGFMQGILSLYEHTLNKDQLHKLMSKFPKSDCVVYLENSFPVNSLGKVSKRRMSMGQDYVRRWKITFACNLTTLTQVLKEQSKTQLVTLKAHAATPKQEEVVENM